MRAIYVDRDIPRLLLTKALKVVWRGVIFSRLSPSRYEDLPEPDLPGPRWVRVKNRQCGICATDLSLLFVDVDPSIGPAVLPGNQRFYLGHEVVGQVTEVGREVAGLKVGDRVIMDTRFQGATCRSQEIDAPCRHCVEGNHARCENASVGRGPRGAGGGWGDGFTAHETEVYPVPADLSDDKAMLIEPLSVGLRAALRRTPKRGEHALILGSGMVGLGTLECVRALSPDCHITAAARHPHQARMARRLGADEVVMGGFDVVYDCVGSARTLQDSLRWARAGGAVVMVGITLAPLKLDLSPAWHQEVDVTGVCAHGTEHWEGGTRRTYDLVVELMLRGQLSADGLITHRFPLSGWRQAIATAMDKRSGAIRVAFDYAMG